jgi:two-component system response regulator RegA
MRLLLVDDDERFQSVMQRALERRGFSPIAASDSREALAAVSAHGIDYAVVDLRLGEDSGLALIESLLDKRPSMAIVVLTAYASIATAVQAIKLGAVHYLAKPVHPDAVVASFGSGGGNVSVGVDDDVPSVRRLEWEHIQRVLEACDGNVSAAARQLGMHRRTLQRKLQKRPVKQ